MDQNVLKTPVVNFSANLQNPRNVAFELVLLIIVSAIFGWFLVLPKRASVEASRVQLKQATDQEAKMSSTLSTTKSLINTVKTNKQDVNLLDTALPLDGSASKAQLLIENYAQETGVTIGNINVGGKAGIVVSGDKALLADPFGTGRSLLTLSGSAYVLGSFEQLESFLRKLENSGRMIDITTLNLESASDGGLSLKAGFNMYYFAPY